MLLKKVNTHVCCFAAIIFSVVAILAMLAACGAPLGEFTMGGQYKVLPSFFRIMAGGSLLLQLFAS